VARASFVTSFKTMLEQKRQHPMFGLAAEGKDLLHEVTPSLGGFQDLLHILTFHAIGRKIFHQHFRQTDNGEQDVVEVMGDTPRQVTDGFHFLGFLQAHLGSV
jgi:hypothetical protein